MAASGAMYGSENVSLEQAISAALETNPEVNQAIMNKEAIEFEREQAQGLYLPRVDIEASAGIRRLENNTRRTLGIADKELYPLEAGIFAEQTIVDFLSCHLVSSPSHTPPLANSISPPHQGAPGQRAFHL